MTFRTRVRDLPAYIFAVCVMGGPAYAQVENLGDAADSAKESVSAFVQLGVAGFFMLGLFLFGAGFVKLKQAADDQGRQTKYSDGAWRLGVGAGLMAVKPVLEAVLGTGGFDQEAGGNMGKLVWGD